MRLTKAVEDTAGDHSMDSEKDSRIGEDTYLCRKTGKRVPKSDPRCPKPEEACKYRLDCIIYALYKEAQGSAKHSNHRSSTGFTRGPIPVRRQRGLNRG